jgi:hypothetical protein
MLDNQGLATKWNLLVHHGAAPVTLYACRQALRLLRPSWFEDFVTSHRPPIVLVERLPSARGRMMAREVDKEVPDVYKRGQAFEVMGQVHEIVMLFKPVRVEQLLQHHLDGVVIWYVPQTDRRWLVRIIVHWRWHYCVIRNSIAQVRT